MFCDSQSAIHLAKNQVYHARTKHIDVRCNTPKYTLVIFDMFRVFCKHNLIV